MKAWLSVLNISEMIYADDRAYMYLYMAYSEYIMCEFICRTESSNEESK